MADPNPFLELSRQIVTSLYPTDDFPQLYFTQKQGKARVNDDVEVLTLVLSAMDKMGEMPMFTDER